MNEIKITLTEQEASDILGCAVSTVQQMCRDGKLPHLHLGNDGYRFPIQAFDEAVNKLALIEWREPVRLQQIGRPDTVVAVAENPGHSWPGPKPKGPPLIPMMDPFSTRS
jgi:excisionase family DNA binding protein